MLFADEITTAIDIIQSAGATGLLVIVVWAFYTGKVVTGSRHEKDIAKCENERNEWKELALAGTELAERHLAVTDRLSKKVAR